MPEIRQKMPEIRQHPFPARTIGRDLAKWEAEHATNVEENSAPIPREDNRAIAEAYKEDRQRLVAKKVKEEGKSIRQAARELNCDHETVRRDLTGAFGPKSGPFGPNDASDEPIGDARPDQPSPTVTLHHAGCTAAREVGAEHFRHFESSSTAMAFRDTSLDSEIQAGAHLDQAVDQTEARMIVRLDRRCRRLPGVSTLS